MNRQDKETWDKVLEVLSNEVLQYVNSKSNELLLQRYEEEQRQLSQYSRDLAAALMLLGERQTVGTKTALLNLLQKRSGIHCDFSKLIKKKINKGKYS